MTDKRLIGTWKSNTRRTMREIRNHRHIPEEDHKKLRSLFGKLQIRYTKTRAYITDVDGSKSVEPYTVVAKDLTSVAILAPDVFDEEEQEIAHIHFDGDYYWVLMPEWSNTACVREYFRRVE